MPTPFPAALSDRLTRGPWRDALPPHGAPLGKGRPFQVRSGSGDRLGLRPMVEASYNVLLAVAPTVTGEATTENGAPASLRATHAFLDRLEAWVERHADHLTWPPSQNGWVDAVRATLDSNDQDGLATILGAFPSQVRAALKEHAATSSLGAWWKGQTTSLTATVAVPSPAPAAPVGPIPSAPPAATPAQDSLFREASPAPAAESAPVTDPAPRVPNVETVAHRAAPVPSVATSSDRVERSTPQDKPAMYHDPRVDETVEWLKTILVRLHTDQEHSMGVKQEWLDEKLKNRAAQGKGWFEEQFFPAIARLDGSELENLMQHWPNHRRFVVQNPVDMVSQARFWSILKAQEPVRTMLYEQALPRMVNMEKVSFDDRFTMAQHMLEWAKRNQDLFRQRLTLWNSWGGSVTEEEVLAPSATPPGDDVFNAPVVVRRSVARWILEQGNDMWTAQLHEMATRNGWTLPKDVTPVATPAPVDASSDTTPAPRRFRPR